ncbi:MULTISPECIES: agmatine/peptidylarginine deiminase [unclassified Marichromatium]|uniref:agmatine deiminase family protein n=1 Tax=unclassified Marichromatium TaxID=2618417 RepID=UPI000F40424D|nr:MULTISPECIES: agmatine deiminase family protein [unclassified Marichromatium]MBO8087578.1 agmatine deiminase family protein [Marichromatium sp.]RNE91092.1 agmatine deiminase family protein [Marichromatium sp. AB31]RNE93749.1 agmatine deiminase family protein [Marichromatium sp. AB32]
MNTAETPTMRRLPAEWEPQSGVMLTWPHDETDWVDQLTAVETLYAELAARISAFEPVLIVCRDPDHATAVRARCEQAGAETERLRLATAPSNDTWARDHGPITVITGRGRPLLLDFRFNGWGGKYPAGLDNRITRAVADQGTFGDCELEKCELVVEGGALETDGRGTLLAVSRTLLDPHRNPDHQRADIEQALAIRLGIRHFLWLEHGAISGDDTDGHIDTLVRFCAPDTLCYARSNDPEDIDYPELSAMERELQALRDPEGRPYRLVPLPSPRPVYDEDDERLPAGYANFLVINGAVLVPVYDDPADAEALAVLGECFPDREVIPIDARPLIRQGGSLHCITMQLPEGVFD